MLTKEEREQLYNEMLEMLTNYMRNADNDMPSALRAAEMLARIYHLIEPIAMDEGNEVPKITFANGEQGSFFS